MSKSKPYSAVAVNQVVLEQLTKGRQGLDLVVGFDIGKFEILAVPRWGAADFGRPWRVLNPEQLPLCAYAHSARKERPAECRGARPEPGREISDGANQAVTAKVIRSRRQLGVTGRELGTGRTRASGVAGEGNEERTEAEVEICSPVQGGGRRPEQVNKFRPRGVCAERPGIWLPFSP